MIDRFGWPFHLVSLLPLAIACGSGEGGTAPPPPPPPPPPYVARLEVTTAESTFLMGHTLQLRVAAFDSAGRPVTPARIVWRSTAPDLVEVDSTGLVHALPDTRGGGAIVQALAPPSAVIGNIPLVVARHGAVKWRLSLSGMPAYGGVAEGPDGTLYYLSLDPLLTDNATLFAITPRGQVKWQRPLAEVHENTPRVGTDGIIYVVGQYVWAINQDGSVRWSVTTRPPDFGAAAFFHEAAISNDGILYAAMGYDLFAFRGATGDTVWVGPRAGDRGWLIAPTISRDGRTVYVSRSTRALYAIDAATGTPRWSNADPDPTRESYMLGAALDGGVLHVPTATLLRDVDTNGVTLETSPDNLGRGVSEPAIAPDGTLYLQAPQNQGLYAFRSAGQELWRAPGLRSRSPQYGGPALAEGGVLYLAALDGFYAVNVSPSGVTVRWRFPRNASDSLMFFGAPLIGRDGTVYSFTSTVAGQEPPGTTDELFAFWEDKPVEPNSPWPMWRHDARRSGQAHR